MDVLSEVLGAVRLNAAFYFEVNAATPWVSVNPSMAEIGAAVMPKAEHVIPFHLMMDGSAWARPADNALPAAEFNAGDIVMFPGGSGHIISSERSPTELPSADLQFYRDAAERVAPFTLVEIGGGGSPARFVCGYLGCDERPFNPLLSALPSMLIVKTTDGSGALTRNLIQAALDERESSKPGSETILAKLSELMFLQALRRHIDNLPDDSRGWLAGLRDRRVGTVLTLIHSRTAEPWTLESLARAAGTSRSKLAERFHEFTGESPMRYLARWRMQLAARMLDGSTSSIAQVAETVGYSSEAAFKRAFKKYVGDNPGSWRRSHQTRYS
jgi:AraC-like DNA-binding protein